MGQFVKFQCGCIGIKQKEKDEFRLEVVCKEHSRRFLPGAKVEIVGGE